MPGVSRLGPVWVIGMREPATAPDRYWSKRYSHERFPLGLMVEAVLLHDRQEAVAGLLAEHPLASLVAARLQLVQERGIICERMVQQPEIPVILAGRCHGRHVPEAKREKFQKRVALLRTLRAEKSSTAEGCRRRSARVAFAEGQQFVVTWEAKNRNHLGPHSRDVLGPDKFVRSRTREIGGDGRWTSRADNRWVGG